MGGLGGHYAKLNKRKTNTVWYHLSTESEKIQQTSEYNKKADSHIQGTN